MATIVLQTAGAALGGLFGPVGALLGRAAGALAGSALDQKLFGKDQVIAGPKLEQARILSSADGAPMPKVYGRVRVGGQIVWATRHLEVTTSSRRGGKGGQRAATVEETAYYANFAVGICEGPVAHFSRIWADGKELDRTRYAIRLYPGSQDQAPDPLIEAKQGAGNAPAMLGTAYAVFEGFPLAAFGNRIPQITFEVVRTVAATDAALRAATIIPGATEAGLHPAPVQVQAAGSGGRIANRNNLVAATDWEASIDELQALCPALERVALVVAWFGDDLRAGRCRVEPRVEFNAGGPPWSVSGVSREAAREVSRVDGKPAYGGTPSDASVLAAIADLRSRGLKVALYPFLMMDIPADNALPDPHGALRQPAHPWRGRITCEPAPGRPGSADGDAAAAIQVAAFVGSVSPASFSVAGGEVTCSQAEFSFRRMILHYAHLAALAGGVDAFLIGSEMRGLTTLRDGAGQYPFVAALTALAADVRQVLGPDAGLTYAADWSEWSGHRPADGSGDVRFHLDSLWAHPAIDAVGIDNYLPVSDWRADGDPVARSFASQADPKYLAGGIAGGEGYDWYYASEADRLEGVRSPIADGLGEPWVWRNKDLRSWWSSHHHERIGGVRSPTPTAWIAQSKPIWFTELGCPAVTMGANQPNVFPDAKSSEAALPRFSTGGRHDLAQNRFLGAHFAHWSDPARNPVSAFYPGPMVDPGSIYLWAWDARPFPAFPSADAVWSDASAWETGHWLNGRIGGCPLDDLLVRIAQDFGVEATARCDGFVDGYVIPGPVSAREALEPLIRLFGVSAGESRGALTLFSDAYADICEIDPGDRVERDGRLVVRKRLDETELPREAEVVHAEIFSDHEAVHSYSRRLETATVRTVSVQLPAVLPAGSAIAAAEARLRDNWIGRETASLVLPHRHAAVSAGDILVPGPDLPGLWRIERVETADARTVELRAMALCEELPGPVDRHRRQRTALLAGSPELLVLNLPIQPETPAVHVALSAEPWAGRYAVWSSPGENGWTLRRITTGRAVKGRLLAAFAPGPQGRIDHAAVLHVGLDHGNLAGETMQAILNGANAAAVRSALGEWEIIQFARAELQPDKTWVLRDFLRGQSGTDAAAAAGANSGADFLMIDAGLERIELNPIETGLSLRWGAGPVSAEAAPEALVTLEHRHAPLASRPWSPVHLSAVREIDGTRLSWVRRSRRDGDTWDAAEVPLPEMAEAYRVEILDGADGVLRAFETQAAAVLYPAADEIADFGSPQTAIRFAVAQIGSDGLPGSRRSALAPVG